MLDQATFLKFGMTPICTISQISEAKSRRILLIKIKQKEAALNQGSLFFYTKSSC